MYKAVFIDIDGTLIKSDHSLSKATIDIIQKLKDKGILVVLVSARPLHGILAIAEEAGLMDSPIAALNGASISLNGAMLFESSIDAALTSDIHEQLQQYSTTIIYYKKMQWFAENKDFYTDYEQKITEVPIIIEPFDRTLTHWQREKTGPDKILVIAEAAVNTEIQNSLKPIFSGNLNMYTSKPTYLEIMNIDASKLNAVKLLIDRYQISREDIITIGDNFNDEEMIAFAGTGIAMGNAPDEVKAKAVYVTDTNNNDGVAKAIAKFTGL